MYTKLKLFLLLSLVIYLAGCSRPLENWERKNYNTLSPQPPRLKIVIDAGHGGKDSGAISKSQPLAVEKVLTLDTALMLNSFLRQMGYETILTRGSDFFVPLDIRAAIANSNHAALFVSVHYNSAPNLKAEGVEVYYYDSPENKKRTNDSKILGKNVLHQILDATKAKSRGVKHGNFAVIRETAMPAILVEGGFVTNDNETARLRSHSYLKTLAESIAVGIDNFLKKERPRRDLNARPAA